MTTVATISLKRFNEMPIDDARSAMRGCCGSTVWCQSMAAARPYVSLDAVREHADAFLDTLGQTDWLEAFAAHPKLGDMDSLKMKFAGNQTWSAGEQSGVSTADPRTLGELAAGNEAYEQRFGFIFILCASGVSAAEMLLALNRRLRNDRATEIVLAAAEQRKITHLRLAKLFDRAG